MEFDPIASPTTPIARSREPAFKHEDDIATAKTNQDAFTNRHGGKEPNVLVILMDDVGWGDFGCYGGGVAVGAPTPHIDALARRGMRGSLRRTPSPRARPRVPRCSPGACRCGTGFSVRRCMASPGDCKGR